MTTWNGRRSATAIALVTALFVWTGCRNPEKRVAQHMGDVRKAWETNIAHQANLPVRQLDWETARQLVLTNNLKLRQASNDVVNMRENYKQIFRDLTPTINLRAGISKRFASLSSVTADDVAFSADSFFNIPGIVGFSARVYAAQLMLMRAKTAYELAVREQTIELYRLFTGLQAEALEMEKLAIQRANTSAMRAIDPFTGSMMETELKLRETTSLKELRSLQQRASDLFSDYSYRWELATNGVPDLRYHLDPLPLADTNRVAQLQMQLVALELEAARATITGIKLRYWPELNIFVSSPPVYQSSGGVERWWDAEQVRGSADLFWQLDTRGYVGRQLRQTRRAQEIQKERYRQEALSLMDRLLFTQELMKATREQLDRTEKEIQFLLAIPPSQSFLSVQKYAADYRALTQQQIRLRRELAEFNALFWFMDENAWAKTPTPPSQ